jgi:dimethylamine/trimethylamine dehydrogenase
MGSVLAELLVRSGCTVTLVTPAGEAANWTSNTLEQAAIQTRLLELGVAIVPHRAVSAIRKDGVETMCIYTGRTGGIACDGVVLVAARLPNEALYLDLLARQSEWAGAGIESVRAIGDALAPGIIAAAIWSGHRCARELDEDVAVDEPPFRRELTELAPL